MHSDGSDRRPAQACKETGDQRPEAEVLVSCLWSSVACLSSAVFFSGARRCSLIVLGMLLAILAHRRCELLALAAQLAVPPREQQRHDRADKQRHAGDRKPD